MAKDTTFVLDITAAGETILQQLAAPLVKSSAEAIASRAGSMARKVSKESYAFEVTSAVGTIVKGKRAIATVTTSTDNPHQEYVARSVLAKARDAGRPD